MRAGEIWRNTGVQSEEKVGDRRSEVGDRKSEVGSLRSEIGIGTRFESVGTIICVAELRQVAAGIEVRVSYCLPFHADAGTDWYPVAWLLKTGWRIVE